MENNFIIINNFVIGNTQKFGYESSSTTNINNSLQTFLQDTNVVVILYNKNDGACYLKTGYDLTSPGDYSINNDYTAYIVKSKLITSTSTASTNNPTTSVPTIPSNSTISAPTIPSNSSNFISYTNGNFMLNSNKFVPVGVNCFGLGLCQEYMNYFSHKQITEIFDSVKKMSGTCIRSHTLGFSAESENSLLDYNLNFREKAWDPIDFSLSEAKRTGIKVIPIFTDPYEYYHGSYKAFCTNGVPKDQFFTHPIPRANFKKYITEWMNHKNKYTGIVNKDCPDIFCFELGNELGQDRKSAGSIAIPTRDWLVDISNHVKNIAPNILIMCPTDETLGQSDEFNIKNLDIYSHHFYWNDFNRMSYGLNNSKKVNKPYIIGEYSSQFNLDWFKYIENQGIQSSFSWSIYPHENDGRRLVHGDGFDIYFDNYTPENSKQLLLHVNHFRRMRGFPEVNQINW